MNLDSFLLSNNFIKIELEKNAIGHYQFSVVINNIKGNFILDTGASASCIGVEFADMFSLNKEESEEKAAGAGAIDMDTFKAQLDIIDFGEIKLKVDEIILFDLSKINEALESHDSEKINGIIGADVLKKLDAVISYSDESLYLLDYTEAI